MTYLTLSQLTQWISLHGADVLFILLALGIVGLPIPDETLLVITGTLISKNILSPYSTLVLAPLGAILGITISFLIGKILNKAMIYALMGRLKMDTGRFKTMETWYRQYGKWSLFFGFFVPGFRHFSGVFAGLMELPYTKFVIFAYTGAIIWSIFFISLGYFLGYQTIQVLHEIVEQYGYGITILLLILALGILGYSYKKFIKR